MAYLGDILYLPKSGSATWAFIIKYSTYTGMFEWKLEKMGQQFRNGIFLMTPVLRGIRSFVFDYWQVQNTIIDIT